VIEILENESVLSLRDHGQAGGRCLFQLYRKLEEHIFLPSGGHRAEVPHSRKNWGQS
jgi:hypothetical protein